MKKILIIGGGVAGLTAGIYALKSGFNVTICERHAVAGGNLTGWQRNGFMIDNCIHWLTGTNPSCKNYLRWCEIGGLEGVPVHYPDSFYTVYIKGQTLEMSIDEQKTLDKMLEISPQDAPEIYGFINAVTAVKNSMGFKGKNFDRGGNLFDKIKAMPSLLRYFPMSLYELADKFESPVLKAVFTGFLPGEYSALGLILAYANFCGRNGGIPEGASFFMADRIKEKFLSLGGELILNKQANKINSIDGVANSVTFSDSDEIFADYLVLATDPITAFSKLLKTPLPTKLLKRYDNSRLLRFSSFQVAFSVKGEVPFSHEAVLEVTGDERAFLIKNYLAFREFSYQKHFAPEGYNIIQSLMFLEEDECRELIRIYNDKELYLKQKQKIINAHLSVLLKAFPQLDGKVQVLDSWSPATYNKYFGEQIGAYMSFAVPGGYIPTTLKNGVQGFSNVVIASQWLSMPGGLPLALDAGVKAVQTVKKIEARPIKSKIKLRATSQA